MKLITRILESAMLLLFFMGGFAQANAQQMDTLSKKQQAIVPIAAMTAKGDTEQLKTVLAEGLDAGDVEEVYLDLISDPQTSGGLLVSVPREELDSLLADFEAVGMETKVSVVGCVKERQEKLIQLKKGKMEML